MALAPPLPLRPSRANGSPRVALALAMSIAFGALAALAVHVANVDAMDPVQRALTIGLAFSAGSPMIVLADRLRRASRDGTSSLCPLLVTVAAGTALGMVSQAYLAACATPSQNLWLFDVPLGHDKIAWIACGGIMGALASIAAFVFLFLGLRAARDLPPVLDAEEKLGIPALASATVGAAIVLVVLARDELAPPLVIVALGLAGLGALARRDAARRAFVSRVFDGTEPGVEIVTTVSDADRARLARVADVEIAGLVLAARGNEGYRSAARGPSLMLLAETKEATLAPIVARQRVVARAAALALAFALGRILALGALSR